MKHRLIGTFDASTGATHWIIEREYSELERPRSQPGIVQWGGREFGWRPRGFFADPKRYSSKRGAHNALLTIKRHERELGLHGRYYG